MKKIAIPLIAAFAILAAAFFYSGGMKRGDTGLSASGPLTKVSVRSPWIRGNSEAGSEIASELGYFKEVGLEVTVNPGSVENGAIRKVLTGEDQFGIFEPSQVLLAMANQKAPLVILAVKGQRSPACMMAKESNNIKTVKDFVGKRVGYNPSIDVAYQTMLKAGGIDRSQFTEVRAGFTLEPFLQDQADVWPAYLTNEPIAAAAKGFPVTTICADNLGVKLYEHALFARKDYVEKNPQVVEAFLRGFVKGWLFTLANPEKAGEILGQRIKDLDADLETKKLVAWVPLINADRAKTDGFGWFDAAMADELIKHLQEIKLMEQPLNGADAVDNSFLKKIPRSIPQ